MPKFLVRFAQFHVEFRLPELLSLAKLEGVRLVFEPSDYSDSSAQRLVRRAILVRDIIELWAVGKDYPDLYDGIRAGSEWKRPEYQTCSFKFMIDTTGASLTMPQQIARIEKFAWMGYQGEIDLRHPDVVFTCFEDYGFGSSHNEPIAAGNRNVVTQYDLKKRGYLGTTSMDAELSLVMANQALARPGAFILDPFVGTGSFLISCSHFGAYTVGSDIDGRQIRGTGGKSVDSNVEQYKLESRVLGSLVCDIGWWDAIVCDPPYGVRAGAKKIASNPKTKPTTSAFKPNGEPRYPQTVAYEMSQVIADLVAFAAAHLAPGGRLVFWLPTVNEQYEPQDIPTHPLLRLVANSEQNFGKWSRRLITMEKLEGVPEGVVQAQTAGEAARLVVSAAAAYKELGHARFRDKYFEPKSGAGAGGSGVGGADAPSGGA
ncbi:hypothetical protein HK105_203825 [Polyrhizophydium stewartii]|uniref:tRNA (guanine(10)-N(2))-methyltransferase n=1 Tax=Polyrhizophydium stewartii TaxID=2732419 RepID=A0ABR4NB62_9FUNG